MLTIKGDIAEITAGGRVVSLDLSLETINPILARHQRSRGTIPSAMSNPRPDALSEMIALSATELLSVCSAQVYDVFPDEFEAGEPLELLRELLRDLQALKPELINRLENA